MSKSFLKFYWRWLVLAFRHSFDYASIVATIISLVVAVGTWAAQEFGVKMLLLEQINEMGGWGYALAAAGALIVFRLLLAPFWIYQERSQQAEQTEGSLRAQLIEEQSKHNPKLGGSIDRVIIGNTDGRIGILILLKITNSGAPTAVEGFGLHIQSSVLTTHKELRPTAILETVTVEGGMPHEETIKPEASIFQKDIYPLVSGGLVRGWLKYIVNNPMPAKDFRDAKPQLIICLEDITGQRAAIKFSFTGVPGGEHQPMYYPGT
jgi:hypothetical protein